MSAKQIRNSLLLVLTAFIWGTAFVAQSTGGDSVGAFSFICVRYLIGGTVLIPAIALLDRLKLTQRKPETREDRKRLVIGGICCGTVLFFASSFQQLGINMGTPVGKAGFLTACYILLVPIIGIFLKRRCGWNIWIGVALTLVGLYFLCMNGEGLNIQQSDLLVMVCALLFSCHILVIDHFSPLTDGVRMSCIQFFTAGILGLVPMVVHDIGSLGNMANWARAFTTWDAWLPILYAGVMSSGVAYTLQIVGQDGLNPTLASLIMSLESVFSVLAGWVILHEVLGSREILGCILIFVAICLAQIPFEAILKKGKQAAEEEKVQ